MADFTETSISRNAKRVFTDPIADVETFNTVVEAFKNDETMNIIKNVSSATYKTKIQYKNGAGEDAGYALFYGASTDNMDDMESLLKGKFKLSVEYLSMSFRLLAKSGDVCRYRKQNKLSNPNYIQS